jgi:hypothetical protein
VHWTNAKGRRTKQGELTRNRPRTGGLTENETGRTNRGERTGQGGTKKTTNKNRDGGFSRLKTVTQGRIINKKKQKDREERSEEEKKKQRSSSRPGKPFFFSARFVS